VEGLVLGHQNGLPWATGLEGLVDLGRLRGLAPLGGELGYVRAVGGGDLGKAIAEGADGDRQDLVSGGEEADDRRPRARPSRPP